MIGGVVLAAGAGTRLGGRKPLAELAGRPLLEHSLAAMAAAPLDRICVVVGADAGAVLEAVDMHGAQPVVCRRWAEGQSASLLAGVEALHGCAAVVVALGDQPFLSPAAVERVVAARDGAADAVRATYGGVPGHPVLLERRLFGRVTTLEGDVGARELLASATVVDVPCDGLGAAEDIDTREQLEAARRRSGAPEDEEAVSR